MMAFASVLASGCGVAHTTDAGLVDATRLHDAGMDALLLGGPDVGYGQAPDVGHDMGTTTMNDADIDAVLLGATDAHYGGAPDTGHDTGAPDANDDAAP